MIVLVGLVLAVPVVNSLTVYGMLHRLTARLSRMTAGLTDRDEVDELYGMMMTDALSASIGRARRRFARTASWALLVPAGWYLFAPQPQLQGCETALWLLLGTNAAMLAVNTLMRIRMCFAGSGRMACVMKARSALKKYSFRQLVTLGMTALLGVMLLG